MILSLRGTHEMHADHVLVTGANGFVGRHVCRHLVESGKKVTACVREKSDISSLSDLEGALRVLRLSSLKDTANLSGSFENVDVVVHLAGRAHVMHETSPDPLREFRNVNVGGTEQLAQVACKSGVRRFIFLSSVKVNGEATDGVPFYADDSHGYSDPYGQSKWEAEERLREIAGEAGMEWVVVRAPLIYGAGVRGNFLSLLKCVLRGIPLPVGSVNNKRSIVSVYNLSSLLCLLLDHPDAANNRFLVGDQEDVSTPDLVRRLANSLHRPPRIFPFPKTALVLVGVLLRRQAAIQRLCSSLVVDKEKVSRVLGWSAPMTLHEGLGRTAGWFVTSTAAK
jgi:nucleoside-diphosphate-sugar epimerase